MESFIKTLKHEEVHLVESRDEQHARARIGTFLNTVYKPEALAFLPQIPAANELEDRQRPSES